MTAMIVGIRLNKPADVRPWWVIIAANAVVFSIFALWLLDAPLAAPLGRTLGFLPMVLTGLAALYWLRREAGPSLGKVALDAALVGVGTALVGWAAFVTPVIDRTGNPFDASLVRLGFLAFDVAAFMVMVHLCIARGRSNLAYPMLAAALLCMAAAVALLVAGRAFPGTVHIAYTLYLVPLIVGFYAAAALHPTMAQPVPVREHRGDHFFGRFSVIGVVLTVTALSAVAFQPIGQVDRLTRLAMFCILFATVLFRSEYAVGASEKDKAEARVRATHDDLTGLPNRAALYDDLAVDARGAATACCLHFMDLNDFKLVNDSFGHRVGDELISLVAARVVAAVGSAGTVYRYGEFVVVSWDADGCVCIPGTDCGEPTIADDILRAMRQPFELSVGRVFVSTSIGVSAAKPGTAPNVDDLIREPTSPRCGSRSTSLRVSCVATAWSTSFAGHCRPTGYRARPCGSS